MTSYNTDGKAPVSLKTLMMANDGSVLVFILNPKLYKLYLYCKNKVYSGFE